MDKVMAACDLSEQFAQARYNAAPDARLPAGYMVRALEIIAPVSHRIVMGYLDDVRSGRLSTASMVENAQSLEHVVTKADTEAEAALTPILQPLVADDVDLRITGEEGLKAAPKDSELHRRYETADFQLIGILDPVDGTMRFNQLLNWAQACAEAEANGLELPADPTTPGQPFGYATGYTLARRETDPQTGEAIFNPIASLIYWPDIRRFALIQPGQGVFEGAYDPVSNSFADIRRTIFKPADARNGVVLAPDVGLIMEKKGLPNDGIRDPLPPVLQQAYPQLAEAHPVCANDVAWRYLRAAEKGQVFLSYYEILCKFWDKAHGYLIGQQLQQELGQGAGGLGNGQSDFQPWRDRAKNAVFASDGTALNVLRQAYQGELPGMPLNKMSPPGTLKS